MRKLVALLTVVLVLAVINWEIFGSERLLRDGRLFYLELAPVDPRSLLQGDYMALNYQVADDLRSQSELPATGWVRLTVGTDLVARQPEVVAAGTDARADQLLLQIHRDNWRLRVGSDAWFFEEGQGRRFEPAKYGAFRTDGRGKALLTGLLDAQFKPL